MFIHDRTKELPWQIRQLEISSRGDFTDLGADLGAFEADLDSEGRLRGQKNWRVRERTLLSARSFGTTIRDSWAPFLGGTGGASASVWGLNEAFSTFLPDAPWLIPAMLGGLVGWKAGEWSNHATVFTIEQISKPISAFRARYYFKL